MGGQQAAMPGARFQACHTSSQVLNVNTHFLTRILHTHTAAQSSIAAATDLFRSVDQQRVAQDAHLAHLMS